MLAHELRRRMAAVRVAGEAIAMLREQGLDLMPMLDLLLAEVADLDELAVEVLGDRRAEAGSEPATAPPDVAVTVQAAARTVAVARGATVGSRPASRPRSRPARPCSARRSRT
jgi:hypothetical protein